MPPKPPPNEKKQIRQFSVAMGLFLGAGVHSILWYKHGAPNLPLVGFAAAFALLGLALPAVVKPVFWLWMKIAHALGWFNTRLILGLVFYLLFTPVGLVTRLLRIDLLDRKWPARGRETYWHPRDPRADRGTHGLERQF